MARGERARYVSPSRFCHGNAASYAKENGSVKTAPHTWQVFMRKTSRSRHVGIQCVVGKARDQYYATVRHQRAHCLPSATRRYTAQMLLRRCSVCSRQNHNPVPKRIHYPTARATCSSQTRTRRGACAVVAVEECAGGGGVFARLSRLRHQAIGEAACCRNQFALLLRERRCPMERSARARAEVCHS